MPDPGSGEGGWYVIRVREALDPAWSVSFGGFAISRDEAGCGVLSGKVIDQAALYGLFSRARDIGLTFISVERVYQDSAR